MLTGGVTAASQRLNISQPTISRLIADLESSIGFKLFRRRGRGVVPTREAVLLFEQVEASFVGLERIASFAQRILNLDQGSFRLGSIFSLAFDVVPRTLRILKTEAAGATVESRVQTTYQLIDWIRTGQLDLAVINPMGEIAGVDCLFRKTFQCVCLLPEGHWLAGSRRKIDLAAVADEPFVLSDRGSMAAFTIDRDLLARIERNAWLSSQLWFSVAAAVRHGAGLGIVDPFTAGFFAEHGGIVCRPVKQDLSYDVAIVAPSGNELPIVAKRYVELLKSHLREFGRRK